MLDHIRQINNETLNLQSDSAIRKILCVEDCPNNMRLVRKILTRVGYQVVEAFTAEHALALVESEMPDLILMDVNLPDIDGLEVTQHIRQHRLFNGIPIIALTANAMHGDRERCLAAGCDGYVAKPIMQQELKNMVSNLLTH